MSIEVKKLIQKKRRQKYFILFIQIASVLLFLFLWEFLSNHKIINPFIFSSPSNIWKTLKDLYLSNGLFEHIFTTLYEIVIAFSIGISL